MNYKLDNSEKIVEKEAENYRKVSRQKKEKIENILGKSSKNRIINTKNKWLWSTTDTIYRSQWRNSLSDINIKHTAQIY